MKWKKWDFVSDAIYCLGNVITLGILHVATKPKEPIRNLKYRTNSNELRFFLGLCNVYSSFFSNFEREVESLDKLIKKSNQ